MASPLGGAIRQEGKGSGEGLGGKHPHDGAVGIRYFFLQKFYFELKLIIDKKLSDTTCILFVIFYVLRVLATHSIALSELGVYKRITIFFY